MEGKGFNDGDEDADDDGDDDDYDDDYDDDDDDLHACTFLSLRRRCSTKGLAD